MSFCERRFIFFCLFKVMFTFYHGESPLNHHLGHMFYYFLLFPTTFSKSKFFKPWFSGSMLSFRGVHVNVLGYKVKPLPECKRGKWNLAANPLKMIKHVNNPGGHWHPGRGREHPHKLHTYIHIITPLFFTPACACGTNIWFFASTAMPASLQKISPRYQEPPRASIVALIWLAQSFALLDDVWIWGVEKCHVYFF